MDLADAHALAASWSQPEVLIRIEGKLPTDRPMYDRIKRAWNQLHTTATSGWYVSSDSGSQVRLEMFVRLDAEEPEEFTHRLGGAIDRWGGVLEWRSLEPAEVEIEFLRDLRRSNMEAFPIASRNVHQHVQMNGVGLVHTSGGAFWRDDSGAPTTRKTASRLALNQAR